MTIPYFKPNTIYCGDCKEVMAKFPNESVDLIYADPPFFSNRHYEIAKRISIYEFAKLTRPDGEPMTLDDYAGNTHLTRDVTLTSTRISTIPFEEIEVERR